MFTELNRTKKNLKLQHRTMKGVEKMREALAEQEAVDSELHKKEKLSPSRIATLRYDSRTLPEEVIVTVCKLYALGNMRLNEIVKRINSTIIRSGRYKLNPLTLPDVYAILYQEKKKPKYTTGKFNVLNSGFTNELSILQFITFFTRWTYGGRFEECYQDMMDKVTSRNNPSRSFCHNTFKLLNRLFRQHKNKGGKKIRNRAYKVLFNDVFTKMRFATINEQPALVIMFKDISHDAVNDIMTHIPGFGDVMKAYLEGQYEIDIELANKQIKLGKDVYDAISKTAKDRGLSEETIINRFHGEKEPVAASKVLLDPESTTGFADKSLNIPVQANDNILVGDKDSCDDTNNNSDSPDGDSDSDTDEELDTALRANEPSIDDEDVDDLISEVFSDSRTEELKEEEFNILQELEAESEESALESVTAEEESHKTFGE